MKKPILVPTDLTDVASKAIHQAGIIAKKAGTSVSLLHVLNEKSPSRKDAEEQLKMEAGRVTELTGRECEIILMEGPVIDVIPQVTCDKGFDLMVIGTHGVHGIKQHFMGANILKLVTRINTPVLVVQKDSPLIENFRILIMPVSSHADFHKEIDSVLLFTSLFGTEVHLYSIYKPGFEWPEQTLKNIEDATTTFELNGVRMTRVKEEQEVYSQGYAKQTLLYAGSAGADLISVMSTPSDDYYYFAVADKEALLLNELHLPVLCTA
jgi:nucleotide-binding universal stress UspA family protein